MFRLLLATCCLAALASTGCVLGPCGSHCNDCDGVGQPHYYGAGPFESFRAWRRGLTCGSGCGETYYDEWSSTPPDCVDPCPEFAGGGHCGGCAGGCIDCGCGCGVAGCGGCGVRPLRTVAGLVVGLYGKRLCGACGYGVDDCSCGGGYSDCGCGGGCSDCGGGSGYYDEGAIIEGHSGGCSTGNCASNHSGGRIVASHQGHRSAAHRHVMNRQQASQQSARVANSTGQEVVHPPQPGQRQKFVRNATRLPQQTPAAFRR